MPLLKVIHTVVEDRLEEEGTGVTARRFSDNRKASHGNSLSLTAAETDPAALSNGSDNARQYGKALRWFELVEIHAIHVCVTLRIMEYELVLE